MNIKSHLPSLLAAFALVAVTPGFGQHASADANKAAETSPSAGQLIRVTDKEAAWAAAERKNYPLNVCVVSDEKLGSMGKSPEYLYRVEGKPDRLVMFCCSGCEEDFMKAPADHLAKIDAAAKNNPKSSKAGAGGAKSSK
jgi:hypothetical protein